ncbi:GNAT family N-acetyltransferase [Mangrovibacterium lignilyticum]|uniref:GNAT family N-acetyltransferase n=1 Tax=Mangrovibacterium lignilyticum TaxID=2668052 RepID=UPI0013D3BC41|nr:GNAT family N-acetyltransferase [Mangrovibacterium lignilyticum]
MIKARYADKEAILNILTPAFEANKSVKQVVKQDARRRNRIRTLMDYSFEVCHQWGEVHLSDDKQAAALLLYPHRKETTVKALLLDLQLAFKSVGLSNIRDVMSRESKIKAFHPKQPFLYLWFLGVAPEMQGHGIGSRMLEEIIRKGEALNYPIYLETSTKENLPLYQRFGFEIYAQLDFAYPLYLLKREV